MTKALLVALMAILSLATTTHAQDTVFTPRYNERLDSIQSPILHQKRYIEVFLPISYKPGNTDKYDVLYVLDGGNWNTGLIRQVQRFVEGEGNMPPTIIVSVTGIDRNVELTPTHLDSWKGSGGGEKFLAYITTELIPYIDKTYPSNGDNTLWGHSLSGMFAVYAMLNKPGSFKSYIATDPSIWWDYCLVAKMAAAKLPAMKDFNATLYVSGREGQLTDMKIDTLETVLKQVAPPGLKWKIVPYTGETHSSVRFKTTYDGLKFTYAGLVSEVEVVPMAGIVLKDQPINLWYFDDTTRLRYTVDGSMPVETSPGVKSEMPFTGPGRVTFRKLTNRSRYDKIVTADFTLGGAPKPVPLPKTAKPGGLSYEYYEGDWDSWPQFGNLAPAKTGLMDKKFDLDSLPRKNIYALQIDGFIEVKEDGYYMFLFDGDNHSRLYLGGKQLMQWEGNYNRRTYTYLLPLTKGFYPIRMEYLHHNQDFRLRLSYLTPSIMKSKEPVPIPVDLQYSVTEPAGTKKSSAARLPSAPAQ
jgi:predicted alpha/beta superfamily hydrolase